MRKRIYNVKSLSIFLLVLFAFASVKAVAQTPEETTKEFYKFYLQELKSEKNPFDRKPTMLKYVSKRLGKWIYSKAYEEYGADYFIDAQDFDENWNPTPSKAVIKGNKATFKVVLAPPKGKKSNFNQTLLIKMIKESGSWKIDSVNDRNLTN